jgi:hypothetical protein
MIYIMVDVEASGKAPGVGEMTHFGAVVVNKAMDKSFYGQLNGLDGSLNEHYRVEAIKPSEESIGDPKKVMQDFANWIKDMGGEQPMFISDNNGFDWQYVNYYFHNLLGYNPFGHSSTNLGSLYKGVVCDVWKSFKHLRKTKHTHCPVDDAMGNVEAMISMQETYDLKINI